MRPRTPPRSAPRRTPSGPRGRAKPPRSPFGPLHAWPGGLQRGPSSDDPRRHARDNSSRRHVLRNHRAGADHGIFSDCHAWHYDGGGPNCSALPHDRALEHPVLFRLRFAVLRRRGGIPVVQEVDIVTNEYLILDGDAFTDKGMALDLATGTNLRPLLNLHERTDRGF